MSNDDEAKAIQREMAGLRRDLIFAVDEASATARQLQDWRYYIHRFPWASAAAIAAAGYLLVPARTSIVRPDADQMEELARRSKLVVGTESKRASGDTIGSKLAGIILAAAGRAAMAYVGGKMGGANQESPNWTQWLQPVSRPPK